MKRIHIIYNPKAGRSLRDMGEELGLELLKRGYQVSLYRTQAQGDATREAKERCNAQDVDMLLAVGGDGTLNEVVNGIFQAEQQLPLAPFAGGTANDFCTFLKLPEEPWDYVHHLHRRAKNHMIDIGKVEDRYFINVLASGMLSEVAHKTDTQLKNILGSLAYYMEGIKEFITRGLYNKIALQSDDYHYNGEYVVFMVSNSRTIGGFKNLSPDASINDGYLNALLIKKAPFKSLVEIAMNLDQGAHVDNPYVDYFTTNKIHLVTDTHMDVDGEHLELTKATVEALPRALECIF